MTNLEMGLTLVVAALYALGTYQGSVIADECDKWVKENYGTAYQLSPTHRAFLTWLWPVATVRAMLQSNKEEE